MGYHVVKLDPSDMSFVDSYENTAVTGVDGNDMILAGGYLYVAKNNYLGFVPGGCDKIDPSDMTLADSFNESGQAGTCLDYDGTYILLGLNSDPGELVRINPATMAEVDRWTGAGGQTNVISVTHDGTYYYVVMEDGTIVQINPATMTTVQSGTPVSDCVKIKYLNSKLYAIAASIPGYLVQLDPSDLSVLDYWEDDTGSPNLTADFMTDLYYVGTQTDPPTVAQVGEEAPAGAGMVSNNAANLLAGDLI
jgi:hypothetical protein